jgi:outer membrane lipoprotein-sorting protein
LSAARSTGRTILPLALIAALLAGGAARSQTGDSTSREPRSGEPWELLRQARSSLVDAGETTADFVQTFVPAGFSTGERESGRLALALPDCLRWDYELPWPRAFLICGEEALTWNPGEASGRRALVDAAEEPGLDLMMLGVERLSELYAASVVERSDGRLTIRLEPSTERGGAFASADLGLDADTLRPLRIAYRDFDGNETAFELSGYRPLTDARNPFEPPPGIEWID